MNSPTESRHPYGNEDWIDSDLRGLSLSYEEKAGLQVYRNYGRAFEERSIRKFREAIDAEEFDISHLVKLLDLLVSEDVRFTPIIACGYADEILKTAFRAAIPPGVPGGQTEMFSGFGPLSDLSKRIRLAYAFDIFSGDLMLELDRLRKVRNRISHDWDLKPSIEALAHFKLTDMYPVEDNLRERLGDAVASGGVDPEATLRIRLIWIMGRVTYEAATYHKSKLARIDPAQTLYRDGGTKLLGKISKACMAATQKLLV